MPAGNPFRDYLRAIRDKLQVQGAGEHAHRAGLPAANRYARGEACDEG